MFIWVTLPNPNKQYVCKLLSQETSWDKGLQNDIFCVEWDVKP